MSQHYRLTKDVFSQTIDLRGAARAEGLLPAGTVVEATSDPDWSPWTNQSRRNHADGIVVRIVSQADGASGAGCAHELLCDVHDLAAVAEAV